MSVKLVYTRRALTPIARQFRKRPLISALLVTLVASGLATMLIPTTADLTGTLGVILGMSGAGVVAARGAGRLEGRERVAWRGVGVSLLIGSVGVFSVAIASSTGADVPAFGPLDSFFLVSYALMFLSILALPHAEGRWPVRVRALVDGLVGAVSLATLAWVGFLAGYLDRLAAAPPGQRVIAMAYPILDVALLIALLMLSIRRSTYWLDRRLLLLSAALIFQTAGDLLFAATGVGELFEEARPFYPLYIAAGICLLAAASNVHKRPAPREMADRPARRLTLVAPYGAATMMLAALVWFAFDPDHTHVPLLALATVAVVVLTFARQAVSIRENRDRVDAERQDLVSSISHELRTPLTSMFGMLELVRAGEIELTESERNEFLETATDQARHMARIVSDLILLARDQDDTIYVAPARCRLDRLVEAAVRGVEGGQVVEADVPPLTVTVDITRFDQAIANLVGNAIKYGGGRVIVTAVADENITIEVHDDGAGVQTKYELVIWNRFERGPRRLDSRVPGSGNGLAIVAKVVKAHGGVAGYRRSEILGGACFFISIPPTLDLAAVSRIGTDPTPLVIAV
jgi:signal transduction histidine kinase